MSRSVRLVLAGAIIGSALTHGYFAAFGHQDLIAVENPLEQHTSFDDLAAPGAFAAELAAHERSVAIAPSDLVTQIEYVAAQVPPGAPNVELEALMARLAIYDPRAVLRVIERLGLGRDMLVRVFQLYAASEPDAALAELRLWGHPATRRVAALAMLDVFGVDPVGIERVAEALPPVEAASFRIDALARFAERDLASALAAAQELDNVQARTMAQQRIAAVLARVDPARGIEGAQTIKDTRHRGYYVEYLLDEWAKYDPDAVLEVIERGELSNVLVSTEGFRSLAITRPDKVLAAAEEFGPFQRLLAQRAVIDELAMVDPGTAYRHAMSLPANDDRESLIVRISQSYADQNAEAALAWAMSLEPRSSSALHTVLSTVAATDPARAVDVVIAEILDPVAANRGDRLSLEWLAPSLLEGSTVIATIADRLAAHGDLRVRAELGSLLLSWSRASPEAWVEWSTRNVSHVPPDLVRNFGMILGREEASEDPRLARQMLQELPGNLREEWLQGVVRGLALRTTVDQALTWLESFRDTPAYDNARLTMLVIAAQRQPEQVARIIASDPVRHAAIVPNVADDLAERDPEASRRWLLAMPISEARDRGLNQLLQRSARQGAIDTSLLEAFSSDEIKARVLISVMPVLAGQNSELGRRLIAAHITEPALREEAEARLEGGARRPPTQSPGL